MIKKIFILFISIFPSCSISTNFSKSVTDSFTGEILNHSYKEIENRKITWNCMIFEATSPYYIYFYSLNCAHCNQIKNKIIEYALIHENLYFIEDSKDILFGDDIDSTIGKSRPEDIYIKGFPSLIEIESEKCVLNIYGNNQIINKLIL